MSDGSGASWGYHPPRHMLYVKKEVPLATFRCELRNGTIGRIHKLPIEERRARFGSNIVPIFVPLAPGETGAQYEARFVEWIQRKHGFILRELEQHDEEKKERYYRMQFANANADGVEKFDPRDFDKDGRYRHHEDARDRRKERRSQSPTRSTSSMGSYDTRNDKSRSPERSSRSKASKLYARHPSTGERIQRQELYAKKYVELDQYKIDYRKYRIAGYSKLPDTKKRELFGSTIVPIHVPLARRESIRQYEERFVTWISKQGYTLRDLETHDDEALERHLRIQFANLNAIGEERFIPPDAKRERPVEEVSSRPTKKTIREHEATQTVGRTDTKTKERDVVNESSRSVRSLTTETRVECSFTPPAEKAPTSAVAAAYIQCACRQCLVKGLRFLTAKVAELSETICETCEDKSSVSKSPIRGVVDLTQDEDPQSPKKKSSSRLAAAITKLVTSKTILNDLEQQSSVTKQVSGDSIDTYDDPVEKQLLVEYEGINKSVIECEKKLGDLMAKLVKTSVTDTDETTRVQDRIQQLREEIEDESKNRNAALAMVIVHIWRHKKDDLSERLGRQQNKNVLHIQRISHEKCSRLTTAIDGHHQTVAKIKQQLDKAMTKTTSKDDYDEQLGLLTRLGQALTKAEDDLRGLVREQREEFQRLVEYDDHLRLLIKTLLIKSS